MFWDVQQHISMSAFYVSLETNPKSEEINKFLFRIIVHFKYQCPHGQTMYPLNNIDVYSLLQ